MSQLSERQLAALIQEFCRTLRVPRRKLKKPIILAPYGPSCVGKSTVMQYFAKQLPFVHIQHDHIRLFFRKKGIDENRYLYSKHLLEKAGATYLKNGYSIILDANFATRHQHVPRARQLAKKYHALFFLIRVTAPKRYVIQKLKRKKFLPMESGGLLPDARIAIGHFLRSSHQFNYERLMSQTLLVVDASKPLAYQTKETIGLLKSL